MLNQRWLPVKSGARPSLGSADGTPPAAPRPEAGRGCDPSADAKREGPRSASQLAPHARRVLDRARRVDDACRQVVGDRGLEANVVVECHRERRRQHHDAERPLKRRPAPGPPHAIGERPSAERQHEQDGGRARRVRQRHRDDVARSRADGDDGGQDRPRTRRIEEAERTSDHEAGPEAGSAVAGTEARQSRQRRSEAVAERRHQRDDSRTRRAPRSQACASPMRRGRRRRRGSPARRSSP